MTEYSVRTIRKYKPSNIEKRKLNGETLSPFKVNVTWKCECGFKLNKDEYLYSPMQSNGQIKPDDKIPLTVECDNCGNLALMDDSVRPIIELMGLKHVLTGLEDILNL